MNKSVPQEKDSSHDMKRILISGSTKLTSLSDIVIAMNVAHLSPRRPALGGEHPVYRGVEIADGGTFVALSDMAKSNVLNIKIIHKDE
jgi:hypothetical protein